MMVHVLVSIRDSKLGEFMGCMAVPTLGMAERHFFELCSEEGSLYFKHPGDFQIFEIGTFDSQTGEVMSIPPHSILSADQVAEMRKKGPR